MMSEHSPNETPGHAGTDSQLEQAVQQALAGQDLDQLMAEAEQAKQPAAEQPGSSETGGEESGQSAEEEGDRPRIQHDMRRGRISAIRGEDVFVDLPGDTGKLQGLVPLTQFDRPPRIGSIMDFVVDHVDEDQGLMFLSREGAISRATWEQLQPGAVAEARVLRTNKGGLELEMVGGIRSFMPASQIETHHVEDLESWIGQKVPGIVQEIDRRSKKVVLSRRQYLEEEAKRVAPDTDELEAKLSRKEEKIEELSAAKELLVDEVCRRKQLAEEEFDASDNRGKVAALSVDELENQLDGLDPAPDAENVTTGDEPTGEGVYDFTATQ